MINSWFVSKSSVSEESVLKNKFTRFAGEVFQFYNIKDDFVFNTDQNRIVGNITISVRGEKSTEAVLQSVLYICFQDYSKKNGKRFAKDIKQTIPPNIIGKSSTSGKMSTFLVVSRMKNVPKEKKKDIRFCGQVKQVPCLHLNPFQKGI